MPVLHAPFLGEPPGDLATPVRRVEGEVAANVVAEVADGTAMGLLERDVADAVEGEVVDVAAEDVVGRRLSLKSFTYGGATSTIFPSAPLRME